jgi:hypothetical protein
MSHHTQPLPALKQSKPFSFDKPTIFFSPGNSGMSPYERFYLNVCFTMFLKNRLFPNEQIKNYIK